MGARSAGYWWGHDPVSEKELAERAEKTSVVKWQQKGTSLDKAKQFTYDPAVIEKESDMGNEINQERMNMVDTHQWLQQPVPYIHALTVRSLLLIIPSLI